MIIYKQLEVGQELKVLGPDETGRIEAQTAAAVAVDGTVKDGAGKEYKFHYAHGAEQLSVVRTARTSRLRQDGPTLEQWVAAGHRAEDYRPSGYAPQPALRPDRPTLAQWVAAGHRAEDYSVARPEQPLTLAQWVAAGYKAEDYRQGYVARPEQPGLLRQDGLTLEQWVAAGHKAEDYSPKEAARTGLRQDGPTLKEFVAAGYKAEDYPPQGYAARPEGQSLPAAAGALPPQQRSGWFGLGKRPGSGLNGPPPGSPE